MTLLFLTACNGSAVEEEDDSEDPGLVLEEAEEEEERDNSAPVAEDDAVTTWPWRQTEVAVLSNDTDANGDSLDIADVTESEHATVTIYNSVLILTQTDDHVGEEVLTYTADDGHGGTATAELTITYIEEPVLIITAPDDGAVIEGDELEVSFEVTGCEISSPSANPAGCHLHKYIDEESYSDSFGHYDEGSFTVDVDEGEHTFSLWLIANDGTDQAFTPLISDTISFTVVEESIDTGK